MWGGFPCDSVGKESACNAGDPGSIPDLERSPEEENGYPTFQADSLPYEPHGSPVPSVSQLKFVL